MAHYGFAQPIPPGKLDAWKAAVQELTGPRKSEYKGSRKRANVSVEKVWLQHTPMSDFAVVYWETKDAGKAFEGLMKSQDPFDKWFRDKILVEVHGFDLSKPPPLNEQIIDLKA